VSGRFRKNFAQRGNLIQKGWTLYIPFWRLLQHVSSRKFDNFLEGRFFWPCHNLYTIHMPVFAEKRQKKM